MEQFTLELANGMQYTLPLAEGTNYYLLLKQLIAREQETHE